MANYLITGGTGLIGTALIEKIQQSPSSITVLTRDRKLAIHRLGYSIAVVEDLSQIDSAAYFDYVINLAGEPIADKRWSTRQKLELWHSRIDLTCRLVKWLEHLNKPPKVLINGSAVGWYGDQGEQVVTENTTPYVEYTHELCDAWEKSAKTLEEAGTRVCLLRTGLVLSSQGGFLKKLLIPFKLGLGTRLATGEQYMPWIHIDDVVHAIEFLLAENCLPESQRNRQGAFNLTAPEPIKNRDFTNILAQTLNRPAFLVAPKWSLKLLLGEMSRLLTTGQKAVPEKLLADGFEFRFNHIKEALKDVLD